MKRHAFALFSIAVLVMIMAVPFVRAQDEGGAPPAGGPPSQTGPSQADIDAARAQAEAQAAQQEQAQTAQAEAEAEQRAQQQGAGGKPAGAGPGEIVIPDENIPDIPDDVKDKVSEKDVVGIYCNKARWKSGKFFDAVDAVGPALSSAVAACGISVTVPDASGVKAEAQAKIDAVCAATTIAEARTAVKELISFMRQNARGPYESMENEIEPLMTAMGDAIRKKATAKSKEIVDAETVRLKAELEAEATRMASELTASAGQGGVDAASIGAQIQSRMTSLAQEKAAGISTKVQAEVEAAIAADTQKIMDCGKGFEAVGTAVNNAFAAGESKWSQYRDAANAKQKQVVGAILDANLATAKEELDKARDQLAAAKQAGKTDKDADEIWAALQAQKQDILNSVDAGDDMAFETKAAGMKTEWDSLKKDLESQAADPVEICKQATAQINAGRSQMTQAQSTVADLQSRCAGKTDTECAGVNAQAAKFSELGSKLTSILQKMDAVTAMCSRITASSPYTDLLSSLNDLKAAEDDANARIKELQSKKATDIDEAIQSQVMPLLTKTILMVGDKLYRVSDDVGLGCRAPDGSIDTEGASCQAAYDSVRPRLDFKQACESAMSGAPADFQGMCADFSEKLPEAKMNQRIYDKIKLLDNAWNEYGTYNDVTLPQKRADKQIEDVNAVLAEVKAKIAAITAAYKALVEEAKKSKVPITSGVVISDIRVDNSTWVAVDARQACVRVKWTTNVPANSMVCNGPKANTLIDEAHQKLEDCGGKEDALTTSHSHLMCMTTGILYHYRLGSCADGGSPCASSATYDIQAGQAAKKPVMSGFTAVQGTAGSTVATSGTQCPMDTRTLVMMTISWKTDSPAISYLCSGKTTALLQEALKNPPGCARSQPNLTSFSYTTCLETKSFFAPVSCATAGDLSTCTIGSTVQAP
ncbi:MAG: hypothetical protein NTY90_05270 [Candidatus Micrarchaeota archaeon]|nr:hypothetical protein [Candidatus Micrarchaeota archaeon]